MQKDSNSKPVVSKKPPLLKRFVVCSAVFLVSFGAGSATAYLLKPKPQINKNTEKSTEQPIKQTKEETTTVDSKNREEELAKELAKKEKLLEQEKQKVAKLQKEAIKEPVPASSPTPFLPPDRPKPTPEKSQDIKSGSVVIFINFIGEVIVKIKGSKVSVIKADSRSSIIKENSVVEKPLPEKQCDIKIIQSLREGALARVEEEPKPQNNFTATIRVTTKMRIIRRGVFAKFVVNWNCLATQ
ncbi:MAG: hypothetical protein JNN15_15550 [Blastocatellia bacterium]|nr:hypothetical protein [Blastocatellia bacterium]